MNVKNLMIQIKFKKKMTEETLTFMKLEKCINTNQKKHWLNIRKFVRVLKITNG